MPQSPKRLDVTYRLQFTTNEGELIGTATLQIASDVRDGAIGATMFVPGFVPDSETMLMFGPIRWLDDEIGAGAFVTQLVHVSQPPGRNMTLILLGFSHGWKPSPISGIALDDTVFRPGQNMVSGVGV